VWTGTYERDDVRIFAPTGSPTVAMRPVAQLLRLTLTHHGRCADLIPVGRHAEQSEELVAVPSDFPLIGRRQTILPLRRQVSLLSFVSHRLHPVERILRHRLVEQLVDLAESLLRVVDDVLVPHRLYASGKLALQLQSRPDVRDHVVTVLRRLGDEPRPGLLPVHLLIVEALAARTEPDARERDGARVADEVNDPQRRHRPQQRSHRVHRRAYDLRRTQPTVGDRLPQHRRAVGVDSSSIGPKTRPIVVEDFRRCLVEVGRRRRTSQRAAALLHAVGRSLCKPHAAVVADAAVARHIYQMFPLQARPKVAAYAVPVAKIRPEFVDQRLRRKSVHLGRKEVTEKVGDGVDLDLWYFSVNTPTC